MNSLAIAYMLFLLGGERFDAHSQRGQTLVDLFCFLQLLTGCLRFIQLLAASQIDHIQL
jgi:hypothetical protein